MLMMDTSFFSGGVSELSFAHFCAKLGKPYPCLLEHRQWSSHVGNLKNTRFKDDTQAMNEINKLLATAKKDVKRKRRKVGVRVVGNVSNSLVGATNEVGAITHSERTEVTPKSRKRKHDMLLNNEDMSVVKLDCWPYNWSKEELAGIDLVILGDVDGGQMAPLNCTRVLRPQTVFVGAFGKTCPKVINRYNFESSTTKIFKAGTRKEAADGILQAAGSQLHARLGKHVPFAIVSDDNGYEMNCIEPWEQGGRRVFQFSPSEFKQMRDVAEVEKIVLSYCKKMEGEGTEEVDDNHNEQEGEDNEEEPPNKKPRISDFLPQFIRNLFGRFFPG